jgi:small GTP-binding protein
MDQESVIDFSIKLLVLGDLSVGKSSFIYRFIEDKFNSDQIPSTGLDLKTADIILENKKIRVQIWDTAGQEKYNSITKNLLLRVQGIIILFDLTKLETFNNLGHWTGIIKENCGNNIPILFVGNKSDLEENHKIKKEDIIKYINKKKNVSRIFRCINNKIINFR